MFFAENFLENILIYFKFLAKVVKFWTKKRADFTRFWKKKGKERQEKSPKTEKKRVGCIHKTGFLFLFFVYLSPNDLLKI